MPTQNTYALISSFVNTIYDDALLVARDQTLATQLVRVFGDTMGMAPRALQEYGTVTINQIAETDDLTSQAFTPSTLATLTPYEYGAQFFMTDQRLESDPFGVRGDAALELGGGMAESIDTKIFSNFSSLTGGTVGAAGTVISWAYVYDMLGYLRNGKVPLNDIHLVVSPFQWSVLAQAASVAGSSTNAPPSLLEAVAQNYFVQRVGPVNIWVSANVPVSGTNAYCAMFHRNALAYDQRRAFRLEPERDASRRGIELNASAVYAHGVWRPKWGVQGLFDNQA